MPAPVTPSTEENPPAAGEHIDEPIPVDQAARAEQQRLQSEAEAAAQAQVLFRTGSAIAPASGPLPVGGDLAAARFPAVPPDRKSVVEGKSGSVRVDLGGRRTINNKSKP